MRKRFKLAMALGATAIGFAAAKPAQAAAIVNPGFEDFPDFTGYTTTGNTTIQASDFRVPAEGVQQALLSTGPAASTGGPANPSSAAAIAAFLGAGSIGAGATEGSAIKQTYNTATNGDTITFSYDFGTNENRPSPFNDFGFVSVNGVITKLADTNSAFVPPPAITGTGDNAGINGFAAETGYKSFTLTLGGAGSYVIGFGVADVGDFAGDSVLLVDNLVAVAGTGGGGGGGVPLPAGMYLMPLALGLAGLYSVKLRRAA